MKNIDRYKKVFSTVFEVEEKALNSDFKVGNADNWDSITQLALVSDLEDEFDIMIDAEDIIDFKSYEDGKQIMKKYEIEIL
jgi:acyl carrier protein